jgi:Bacteriophage abortive infection AbiH
MRVIEGIQLVDSYFKDTFKPTERILRDNKGFFESLSEVRQIRVMGHSLSEVDYPYFEQVIRHVDATQAQWMVSYYGDPSQTRDRFSALEINPELVEFALLSDF